MINVCNIIFQNEYIRITDIWLCCDPSSEPSHRDGSDEDHNIMVSLRNMKIYPSIIIKYPHLSRVIWQMTKYTSAKFSKIFVQLHH